MSPLWHALTQFDVQVGIFVVVGVVLGYVVGSLPGLTGGMAMVLLLPFSYGMQPLPAIALLVCIFIGAMNGGSLSSILYNIPGTPSAAATAIDGYPAAQQGRVGKAISTATIASFIGAVVSILSLMAFAPLLATVALEFGQPEYFALAVFGMSIICSVAADSIVKGLMAGFFGLLISMVGFDAITATPRYTFGVLELQNGISIIPVLIGLFGVSEILKLIIDGPSAPVSSDSKVSGLEFIRWSELKSMLPTMLRGGIIGTVLGAIPGIGASIASFVSLNETKRVSKHPERFGTGYLHGVAAPESGNNGVNGGTMIPLLTFGIPGESDAAIILGAFLIHGLTPGPQLFVQRPDLVYGLFWAMLFGAVVMLVQGLGFVRVFVKVFRIPQTIFMPIIVLLTVVGAFADNNTLFGVFVMLGFGFVGYVMTRIKMPLPPVILGVILGPLMEDSFRRAVIADRGVAFLYDRPITVGFLALAGVAVGSFMYSRRKSRARVIQ